MGKKWKSKGLLPLRPPSNKHRAPIDDRRSSTARPTTTRFLSYFGAERRVHAHDGDDVSPGGSGAATRLRASGAASGGAADAALDANAAAAARQTSAAAPGGTRALLTAADSDNGGLLQYSVTAGSLSTLSPLSAAQLTSQRRPPSTAD
jgi:hypothetical protein